MEVFFPYAEYGVYDSLEWPSMIYVKKHGSGILQFI
jgi:hypothetical protein